MTELNITRTLQATPDRVWRAWTSRAELAEWFWPASFNAQVSLDVRPGGRWRIESAHAGMAIAGEFVAVEPLERLVYTWRWDGEDDETLVTVTFVETLDGGTALTVRHERFDSEESVSNHEQGWNDCLDRLPATVIS